MACTAEVSREDVLLDRHNGGGLEEGCAVFLDAPNRDEPFILHNVDVISTIDFHRMIRFHNEGRALATLAVQDRRTSRYLLSTTIPSFAAGESEKTVGPNRFAQCRILSSWLFPEFT